MAAYLVDNPPVRSQYRSPRRADPSGVVVAHTAENTPDFVAFDGGAEAVAKFIRTRTDPGSYHDLVDSDSAINLVEYDDEAFHDGTGSNPHSYGVSGATRADVWPLAPQAWRDGCIYQMAAAAARYAVWLRARSGIIIPARRITRTESDNRVPGFISHEERDPGRRSDPGAQFPWAQFLATFDRLNAKDAGSVPKPTEGTADMAHIVKRTGNNPKVYLVDAGQRRWLNTPTAVKQAVTALGSSVRYGAKTATGDIVPLVWDGSIVDLYPPLRPGVDD